MVSTAVLHVITDLDVGAAETMLSNLLRRSDSGRYQHAMQPLGMQPAMPSAWGKKFPDIVGKTMPTGMPCVVTDACDAGEVSPSSDAGALADAFNTLIDLRPEGLARLGAQARARIVDRFAINKIVERDDALYRQMGAGGALPAAASSELV